MTAGQDESGGEAAREDLGDSVANLMYVVERGREKLLKPHGVTSMEFNLLRALQHRDSTATDLAEVVPVDASRISRLVASLADKGLLRRRRLRNDRRTVMLRLTEKGARLTDRLTEHVKAHEERLVEGVGQERLGAFYAALRRIIANHAALNKPGD